MWPEAAAPTAADLVLEQSAGGVATIADMSFGVSIGVP